MPELPDLQVFSQNLTRIFKNKVLVKVNVLHTKKLNVPAHELQEAIEGQVLEQVSRSGKQLYFHFKNGRTLALHLMLNGELYVFQDINTNKHTVLELVFKENTGLAFTDYQKQARPILDPEPEAVPDALAQELDFSYLKQQLQKKRSAIKTLLVNQSIIRGIGNAYADEILYNARISPFSTANKIPDEQIEVLLQSIKNVLQDSGHQILKLHPDIISGEVREFLKVHNPDLKYTASGAIIHQKPISSRKTYFTDEQELFG